MRLIVPLQGVVQGRGGLFLGSVIPCALFYFRRNRPRPPTPPPSPSESSSQPSPRLLSRSSSGPAYISYRAQSVNKSGNSPYYAGLQRHSHDPYDPRTNPDGVIQLGLADNKLSLDLVRDWVAANVDSLIGVEDGAPLSISGIACYQKFDGIPEMKNVKMLEVFYL